MATLVTAAFVNGLSSQAVAQTNYATGTQWNQSADDHAQESLSSWRQALASSSRKVANAVIIGDSIACCVGPENYENVWTNSLRSYINVRYKQHGSGVIPVGNNNNMAVNPP